MTFEQCDSKSSGRLHIRLVKCFALDLRAPEHLRRLLKIINDNLALKLHLDIFLFLELWFGVYYVAEESLKDLASAGSCESSNL